MRFALCVVLVAVCAAEVVELGDSNIYHHVGGSKAALVFFCREAQCQAAHERLARLDVDRDRMVVGFVDVSKNSVVRDVYPGVDGLVFFPPMTSSATYMDWSMPDYELVEAVRSRLAKRHEPELHERAKRNGDATKVLVPDMPTMGGTSSGLFTAIYVGMAITGVLLLLVVLRNLESTRKPNIRME
eukprot:m51a1_g3351 putative C-tail anchored protein (186) ;mRNA; f:412630-413417